MKSGAIAKVSLEPSPVREENDHRVGLFHR